MVLPRNFDESGYGAPETAEGLKALTQRIADDGATPWRIGLGADAATGWPATDWVEEFVLRTQPPEVYDQRIAHEIPFDDPRIFAANEEYGWFARTDDSTPQGASAGATTDFRDSPAGLFAFPPECYMHRQASFVPNFFPAEIEVGSDADFFCFPAYADAELEQLILGSGGVIAKTSDRDMSIAFIEFLKLPTAHEIQISQGKFLTRHLRANSEAYATKIQAAQSEVLTNATTFRFDGSDLMPGEFGTSAVWQGMVDYQIGASAEDVAADIENRGSRIQ